MADTGDVQGTTGVDGSLDSIASLLDQRLTHKGDSSDASEGDDEADEVESEPESQEAEAESDEDEADAEEGEADEGEEPEKAEEQPQKFRVKVDDAEQEVTLDELLKGYSREADYTRKTMKLSEREKALDAERETEKKDIAEKRAQHQAIIDVWEKQLKSQLPDLAELEKLRATDPLAYATGIADRQVILEQLQTIQSDAKRLKDEDAQKSEAQKQRKRAEEADKLLKAVPDWKDYAKYQSDMGRIVAYAGSLGLSQDEMSELANAGGHRLILMARDAAAYRELQTKKPEPVKKQEAVKTATPGVVTKAANTRVTDVAKAAERVKQTGHINDVAALLRARGIA